MNCTYKDVLNQQGCRWKTVSSLNSHHLGYKYTDRRSCKIVNLFVVEFVLRLKLRRYGTFPHSVMGQGNSLYLSTVLRIFNLWQKSDPKVPNKNSCSFSIPVYCAFCLFVNSRLIGYYYLFAFYFFNNAFLKYLLCKSGKSSLANECRE